MSNFGKIGWGDNSDDDEDFFKLDSTKSLCNNASSNFKKTLYKRNSNEKAGRAPSIESENEVPPHPNDYICNGNNNHIYKIRDTYFHLDKLKRAYIICSPHKHVNKISQLTDKEKINFLEDIDQFCIVWNINSYSVLFNSYEKYHFNAKIKCDMKQIDIIKKNALANR